MFINILNLYWDMEFDELLITTGVDALVRLVKEKQRIELEEASGILNIPQETIEDWTRVLEEEGILKMEYRLTRIYLLWVRPTEEEISQEKESFYEEKKGLEGEVERIRQNVSSGVGEAEGLKKSFDQFYAKVYGRMEALEKMVALVPAAKTISEDILGKYSDDLSKIETDLQDARTGLRDIKSEIAELGIAKEKGPSEEMMERIDGMAVELGTYSQQLETLRKKASSQEAPSDMQMPTVRDIKKKLESMQKDFTALRSRNAQIREDMVSLHESSEILKSVAESIMGQEDKIGALHADMAGLSQEAERLAARSEAVVSKVRQSADLIERLGDSVDIAKGVLKKFPSQEKVMENLEKLRADEEALADKTAALEKLLEAVGGKQVTSKQFAETVKKMEDRSHQMRKEMDSLEAALHDEKSTYLTFQKIKERIVPSIEGYQQQLDSMETKVGKISVESAAQMKSIRDESQKLQQSLKGGQVQEAVKLAEEIREKKRMLDEIRGSFDDLSILSENLTKRVTLLSREAKLLEIRVGGEGGGSGKGGGGGTAEEEKAIRQRLDLSKEEEMEFRKKREELKRLIQKLWE
jgi:DNA repair exonuclease SbcCD ATPase subunit